MHAVYSGSPRLYLPGYTIDIGQSMMHGGVGQFLRSQDLIPALGVGVGKFAFHQ
jgi:hypothetical protein